MTDDPVLVVIEILAVRDSEMLKTYQLAARTQLQARGARVLARGGSLFEGAPPFVDAMVQLWPSASAFESWQSSSDYAPYKAMRQRAVDLRMLVLPAALVRDAEKLSS
jgi:uncharacterized protein (DUF1330 family)